MKKTRKITAILVIIAVIAAGVLVVRLKKKELSSVPPPKRPLLTVETAKVKSGAFAMTRRYLATVKPKVSADIAPRLTGHLVEVLVREGEAVKKGQLLAALDDRRERDRVSGLESEVAAARTALLTQEGIFSRDERLFSAKALSREALDRSKSARDAARARLVSLQKALSSARTDLSYTRLFAPFDGVITERYQDPGDLAVPGKPVVSMEEPAKGYFLEARIPQREFPLMKRGAQVEILPDEGLDFPPVKASISRIHPAVRQGSLAAIEADVPRRPFDLPSGSTIMVEIETGMAQGFRIPVRALLENTNGDWIYLVGEDKKIRIRKARALWKGSDYAVVKADGLTEGREVVVAQESALFRLHEGQKVNVAGDGREN